MYNREYTPERITELKENEIFVFGSNLAGAHGAVLHDLPMSDLGPYGAKAWGCMVRHTLSLPSKVVWKPSSHS